MDRKKELKEQYKQYKPEMGILIIRSNLSTKYYLEGTQNLRASINGNRFKLEAGGHKNRALQKDWLEHGEKTFTIEVLDNLEYDKDESKTDYSDDLELLIMEWEERLGQENSY
jgi:hypothetical protein